MRAGDARRAFDRGSGRAGAPESPVPFAIAREGSSELAVLNFEMGGFVQQRSVLLNPVGYPIDKLIG